MLTHTKIGPCIILRKESGEILTIDLVTVFPVEGNTTMELFNEVIETLIVKKPPFWLKHFQQLMKRDVILPEVYDNIKEDPVVNVAIKILHYGPEDNYIIRPGQEMEVEKFKDNATLKGIYIWMKAIKDILDVPAKSFFMKKVVLLPEFVAKCERVREDDNNTKVELLKEALSHPDLKPAFETELDFERDWRYDGIRLK
jgi:hypothetical protein